MWGCCLGQVLQTLGTETYRPSSASQCVAGIACAEIPMNQWPELIPQLVANVTNQHSTEHMKESTLEAIGYICQDIVSTFQTGLFDVFIQVLAQPLPSTFSFLAVVFHLSGECLCTGGKHEEGVWKDRPALAA